MLQNVKEKKLTWYNLIKRKMEDGRMAKKKKGQT